MGYVPEHTVHRGKPRGLARSSEEKVIDNGKNGDNLG